VAHYWSLQGEIQYQKANAMKQINALKSFEVREGATNNNLKEVIEKLIRKNLQREKLIELGKLMEGGKISPDEGMKEMRKVLENE